MASISVRDLDEDVAAQLKVRAARHGRSMEAEVRAILTEVITIGTGRGHNLAQAAHDRLAGLGGADLEVPRRSDPPRVPDLPDR